jgi:hypothetical protein
VLHVHGVTSLQETLGQQEGGVADLEAVGAPRCVSRAVSV